METSAPEAMAMQWHNSGAGCLKAQGRGGTGAMTLCHLFHLVPGGL